jgi:hypothetical protein
LDLAFTTSGGLGDVDLFVKFGSPPSTSVFDCSSTSPTTDETSTIPTAQAGTNYVLLKTYSDISGVTLTGRYDMPTLFIDDNVVITEGNSGTKVATFAVRLSRVSTSPVTYDIATATPAVLDTATPGSDYVARNLIGETIAPGQTSATFAVMINGDSTVEPNETFVVQLDSVVGAVAPFLQAWGTIINDEGPRLSIADVSIAEGDTGIRLATFTVKLSQAAATNVTYTIVTYDGMPFEGNLDADGTAHGGIDYASLVLTMETIAAGQTSRTFAVPIYGNTTPEADKIFQVGLFNVAGASVFDQYATGTIINDDANANILWHNSRTGASALWKSADATTVQSMTRVSNLAWKIVGVGDFNGDGKDDVLWRNDSTGANTIWKSANAATTQSMTGVSNLAWKIVGVGDFDGDGRDDVLWRNGNTGANTIWKSANAATTQSMTGVTDPAWKIVGVGDFDGDGKDDVLWRNNATGADTIWKSANAATRQQMNGVSKQDWKIVGVGDFDGDGKDDVLWRNDSTGANAIWKSANAATIQPMTGVTHVAWRIVGTGDYNGDGQDDVLWRNLSTGANTIWKAANASTLQSVKTVSDLAWEVAR